MQALGAAHVLDYAAVDYTRQGKRYDLILDMQAWHTPADNRRALAPRGQFVVVGGSMALIFRLMLRGLLPAGGQGKRLRVLMIRANRYLAELSALLADGTLRPVIDRTFPLAEVPAAIRAMEAGHAKGKFVITLDP